MGGVGNFSVDGDLSCLLIFPQISHCNASLHKGNSNFGEFVKGQNYMCGVPGIERDMAKLILKRLV
jgi:hypothetical protein